MTAPDLHLDTGAMALDALPPDEFEQFSEHLLTCPTCPGELLGFAETAALLGSAVAVAPPARLRDAVLAAIRVTPQLPPLAAPGRAVDPLTGRHRAGDTDDAAPAETEQTSTPPTTGGPGPSAGEPGDHPHRPWYRRGQTYLIAAVTAAVIAGGTTAIVVANRGTEVVQSCAVTASDRVTAGPVVGTGGDVVYSQSCQEATVTITGLDTTPAEGKVYQMWALPSTAPGTTARSLGVVQPNADGSIEDFTAELQPGETIVALSVEPGPGPSNQPTSTPIWVSQF